MNAVQFVFLVLLFLGVEIRVSGRRRFWLFRARNIFRSDVAKDEYDFNFDESEYTSEMRAQELRNADRFENNIYFQFYDGIKVTHISSSNDTDDLAAANCNSTDKFSIIVHGWKEDCENQPWTTDLLLNLQDFRGGCLICMDYGVFSKRGYTALVRLFENIVPILTNKLKRLHQQGMKYENLHLFGFSYGGQMVVEAGKRIGNQQIGTIDTCDMAGPGFDGSRFYKNIDHKAAAKNVQCIHTSQDKGTRFHNGCHQNWRMGKCGQKQDGAGRPPLGSHGLCPVFYNLAFTKDFTAIPRPTMCTSMPILTRNPEAEYPEGYKMGYMEPRKTLVSGQFYAYTSKKFPFNETPPNTSAITEVPMDEIDPDFDIFDTDAKLNHAS